MERIRRKKFLKGVSPYLFLAPALITIFIFVLLPILYTIYISFTDYSLKNMDSFKLIGLQNFKNIIHGPFTNSFLPIFLWTMVFAVLSTAGCFFTGLILAIVLSNKNMKEAFIYKAILIIPWALPAVIAIVSWRGLFNTNYGAINLFLLKFHMIKEPIMWLANKDFARAAVIIVNIWLGFPYMMNVCIGAISAIPEDYYESAELDGANRWVKFKSITLPTLTQTAYPLLISSFAFNFNNFNSAYLLTGGGPANPNNQYAGYTDILTSTAYNLTTTNNQYAIAAALSILIFFVVGTISFIQMKASGQFKEVN
ncbi:sugar ABC transporter permease [Clostridium sp. 19966]|uniref:carbohydrate ABC transporter permease n=1 Tax=Clostridium sp. 19966 TaxID=2768166 RepID=UPI0028DEB677|nr:sugar ABC transporter permease [Clostridium sp. 19966]MDT8717084.1 sugar ABC transporter permease [Clostridium sp. 19966]